MHTGMKPGPRVLVETLLTVGQVETLSNLHSFLIKKARLDFVTSLKSIFKISLD